MIYKDPVRRLREARLLIERECGGPPRNDQSILGAVYRLLLTGDEESLPKSEVVVGSSGRRRLHNSASFHK